MEDKIILHCMKKDLWDKRKDKDQWGHIDLERFGFIHCSTIENFDRVTPNWKDLDDELVTLCIDTEKLQAPVRYEDLDGSGEKYPHIYGLVNREAVVRVLPYERDSQGSWIRNEELK